MAKRSAKSKVQQKVQQIDTRQILPYILWAVVAGGWLLLAVALVTYDAADPPGNTVAPHNLPAHNLAGLVGAYLAHHLYLMIGPGIWIAMLGALAFMINFFRKERITQPALRIVGILAMSLISSAIIALLTSGVWRGPQGAGGVIAIFITSELRQRFNALGTMLILAVMFWIAAVLAMDQVVVIVSRWVGRACMALTQVKIPKPVLAGRFNWPLGGGEKDQQASFSPFVPDVRTSSTATIAKPQAIVDDDDEEDSIVEAQIETDDADDDDAPIGDAPGAYVAQKKQFDPDALRAKIKQLPINFAPKVKSPLPPAREIDLSGYRFPGLDLLVEPEGNFTQEMERMVRDQAVHLEEALQQYRIDGEVVGIDSGPVITLFEVRLAPGTKVSQLGAISSDLARALKSQNIRIVPNTAGKDTVGIEVPNLKKERVRLKELMTGNPDIAGKMHLPMYLGKDASGTPLIDDLTKMPHMLIAGTTGSGKSVCMNSIIMSFLFSKRPDELRLVLVDPKMVELSMFKDVPHLMCPVVTEMSKAAAILEWATNKMDERYELLAEAGVRDIASYNSLSWEELKERFRPANENEEAVIPKKLPYLVFVIDELADMMLTNKEVEGFIVRLAEKARAVGLHLILATQRPQANVVTGLIKGNMPCRVSFKVASGLDSRIVLDQKGAEVLLGQGDMLFLSPRSSKLTRAQGTLVDDSEIRRTVAFLREVAQQNFEPQLIQLRAPTGGTTVDGESTEGADNGERDPLFEDAVRVVLETQRGSVSLLQRRLTIGYSRASRLIEQIARAGLLGDYKGSQAREVLVSIEEWEAMKAQAEADAAQGTVFQKDTSDADPDVPDEFDDEYKN